MSRLRRTIFLSGIGVALLAILAALPAPRLIFRRSPTVADRLAGDVRRIVMAVEPNGIVHAAIEVWTDSDWDIEYWSSVPALTPQARIVTHDLIEQRDTVLAIGGPKSNTLAMAWVDYDAGAGTYALRVTSKCARPCRNFPKPVTVDSGIVPIAQPSVTVRPDGLAAVAYVRGGVLTLASVTKDGRALAKPLAGDAYHGVSDPSYAIGSGSAAVAFVKDGTVWMRQFHVDQPDEPPVRIAAHARAPVCRAEAAGRFSVAYASLENGRDVVRAGVASAAAPLPAGSVPYLAGRGVAYAAAGDNLYQAGFTSAATLQTVTAARPVGTRACCPFLGANSTGAVWTAWLLQQPVNAIYHLATIVYEGSVTHPYTAGGTIPITKFDTSK